MKCSVNRADLSAIICSLPATKTVPVVILMQNSGREI